MLFKNRAQIPIEQRNYSLYYLVLSGLLFLGTMWAVVDEIATRRPWKEYQKDYLEMADTLIQQRVDQAANDLDSADLADARLKLTAAQDSMQSNAYNGALAEFNRRKELLIDETREFQFAKSRGDEAYYFYKKSLKEGSDDAGEKQKLEQNEAQMACHQQTMNQQNTQAAT